MNNRAGIVLLAAAITIGARAMQHVASGDPQRLEAPSEQKRRFEINSEGLVLPGPVIFRAGSDALSPESDEVLNVVKAFLDAKPDITLLRIEGHTDNTGNPKSSQELSERRALAVARWLVKKGIDCKRLVPVGFGETKPAAPNDGPENKAKNRRILFKPAALRGHLIGGLPADGGGQFAGDILKTPAARTTTA